MPFRKIILGFDTNLMGDFFEAEKGTKLVTCKSQQYDWLMDHRNFYRVTIAKVKLPIPELSLALASLFSKCCTSVFHKLTG